MIKPRRIDFGMAGAQAAIVAGLAAAFFVTLSKHGFFGYGDAPSHTLIARRVWDHHDASLAQLGTHWGPLYHALQLPLAWLYPLYASGAAAITVSVLATIVTAAYLYRLALLVSEREVASVPATPERNCTPIQQLPHACVTVCVNALAGSVPCPAPVSCTM